MSGASPVRSSVDLHIHSCASDGELTDTALVLAAAHQGVRVVARVDHNTLAGAESFAAAARGHGIEAIHGCEISVRWRATEWHLLGYHVDPGDQVFADRVESLAAQERSRFGCWLDRFADYGIVVDRAPLREVLSASRSPYFGRFLDAVMPSLTGHSALSAYALRPAAELVNDWFTDGKPFHVPEARYPAMAEALDWVSAAGGVAVLAHPGRSIRPDRAIEELRPLVDGGLAGIEVWTSWHDARTSAALADAANRLGLLATQGSDFHGSTKPWAPAPGLLPAAADDPDVMVEGLAALARPRSTER